MKFENNIISIEYGDNWIEKNHKINDCLIVLDCVNKKSRIMLMEYPNQAVNLYHLKSAVELFPRDDELNIVDSCIKRIDELDVHELVAININSKPPLKTKSIGLIHDKDVYIFNYMTFGLNNKEDFEFEEIVKSIKFK